MGLRIASLARKLNLIQGKTLLNLEASIGANSFRISNPDFHVLIDLNRKQKEVQKRFI